MKSEMKLTKETFLLCRGCKYNKPYGSNNESVCWRQETAVKQGAENIENCEDKKVRVYSA